MNKLLVIIPIFILLFISGCQEKVYPECKECRACELCKECQTCEVCKELPKEKALLGLEVIGWYIDTTADYRMFFDTGVINYGNVEANDVVVVCNFKNEDNKILSSVTKKVGDIPPLTIFYKKLLAVTPLELKQVGKSYCDFELECKITKCNNCEILSKKEIPMNKIPFIGYV